MSDYFTDFLADAGLDKAGAETLIRLAATASVDGWANALRSFSEPDEVETLAQQTAGRLYGEDS